MPINVVPKFLQKAFASAGAKADIPVDADLLNGRAGYNEGFPPVNMTPVAAGGIPPYGQDMNGVLYDLSAAIQYLQSGVNFPFDETFATAVGGYAAGAIVSDASDKTLLWVNGTANNTAFPSGWTSFKRSDPTETVRGLPLVATAAEVKAGLDGKKMLTPLLMANAFGVGQSIVDVTGSRSSGVIYTNTTNRPIFVAVEAQANVANSAFIALRIENLDSSVSRSPVSPGGIAVNGVVAPGATYTVTVASATLTKWTEFR